MAILRTIDPTALVHRPIAPLASTRAGHSTHLPLAIILPALFLTNEHTYTRLVPIHVISIIEVTIGKLSDSVAVRNIVLKVAVIKLAFGKRVLADALHLAGDPVALICLLERVDVKFLFRFIALNLRAADVDNLDTLVLRCPDHFSLSIRLASINLALIDRSVGQVKLTFARQCVLLGG